MELIYSPARPPPAENIPPYTNRYSRSGNSAYPGGSHFHAGKHSIKKKEKKEIQHIPSGQEFFFFFLKSGGQGG